MVYRLDPDGRAEAEAKGEGQQALPERRRRCSDCLRLPKAKVKRVKVRKVAVDLEIDGDDCCD